MQTVLITASSILMVAGTVPYIVEILRGKAKPRIVSWFTWTLLTGVACVATFSDGQAGTGVMLAAGTFATLSVVILGLKYGDRHFEKLDIVCQAGALAGLALWLILDSPAAAVLVTVAIDLIGYMPTFKHSWQRPHEETWITFASGAAAGGLVLLSALGDWRITAILYPLYLLLANSVTVLLILKSPHRHAKIAPAELREL